MTERIVLARLRDDEQARPAAALAAAGLACFPTDTVYGIGGPLRAATVAAVVGAKGRDPVKPLQVVFPTLEMLFATVALPEATRAAVGRLLPGPFTLVVPYPAALDCPPPGHIELPDGATVATLGVRVPAWPAPARALARLPFPLLASSANRSGGADPATLDDVDAAMIARCDLLLDAGPLGGVSSTVVDLTTYHDDGAWRTLREGAVAAAEVGRLLDEGPSNIAGNSEGCGHREKGAP